MFFHISNNTILSKGLPWAQKLVHGRVFDHDCPKCSASGLRVEGNVAVRLDPKKGVTWPDSLGIGAFPLFIVSERVLADWERDCGLTLTTNEVTIEPPLPARLAEFLPPRFFWIDGSKLHFLKTSAVEIDLA